MPRHWRKSSHNLTHTLDVATPSTSPPSPSKKKKGARRVCMYVLQFGEGTRQKKLMNSSEHSCRTNNGCPPRNKWTLAPTGWVLAQTSGFCAKTYMGSCPKSQLFSPKYMDSSQKNDGCLPQIHGFLSECLWCLTQKKVLCIRLNGFLYKKQWFSEQEQRFSAQK